MPKTITVETTDVLPSGERTIVTHTHEAEGWATAQGGDLLILGDLNKPLALYARGVWRRAYHPEQP